MKHLVRVPHAHNPDVPMNTKQKHHQKKFEHVAVVQHFAARINDPKVHRDFGNAWFQQVFGYIGYAQNNVQTANFFVASPNRTVVFLRHFVLPNPSQ